MITEDIARVGVSAMELAMKVISDALKTIPIDDRGDVFDLFEFVWSGEATDDDFDAAHSALIEILTRKKSGVKALSVHEDGAPSLAAYRSYVGQKIRELRKKANLTQEELADKSGILQGYISRLEASEHSPSYKTLAKIAAALGVTITELDPSCDVD